MVNDQIRGTDGIDLVRIPVQLQHGIPHRSKVHHCRDTGKVLQDDTGGLEGHLHVLLVALLALDRLPVQDVLHVLLRHLEVVTVADSRLQQDSDREGQLIWNLRTG